MTLYSKIIGTGSYLPQRRVTNAELAAELAAKGVETSDEWIVSRSGIAARHYAAADQNASDLAVEAGLKASKWPARRRLTLISSSSPVRPRISRAVSPARLALSSASWA